MIQSSALRGLKPSLIFVGISGLGIRTNVISIAKRQLNSDINCKGGKFVPLADFRAGMSASHCLCYIYRIAYKWNTAWNIVSRKLNIYTSVSLRLLEDTPVYVGLLPMLFVPDCELWLTLYITINRIVFARFISLVSTLLNK